MSKSMTTKPTIGKMKITTWLLFYAIHEGDVDLIKLLIDCGVNVNVNDNEIGTPLHCAVECQNPEIVEALIRGGANVNAKDDTISPLHFAGSERIAEALIRAGADINAKDEDGKTPLHWATCREDFIGYAEVLIRAGADVNAVDGNGDTPLHNAAYEGNIGIARLLVANGADVSAKSIDGKTPLDLAPYGKVVKKRKAEVAVYLSSVARARRSPH